MSEVKYPVGAEVVVRCQNAGAFAGALISYDPQLRTAEINARRLHYWDGAASLSEIANRGVSKPGACRFTARTNMIVMEVIELIPMTEEAISAMASVPLWSR
jgi:hypothetical protein